MLVGHLWWHLTAIDAELEDLGPSRAPYHPLGHISKQATDSQASEFIRLDKPREPLFCNDLVNTSSNLDVVDGFRKLS